MINKLAELIHNNNKKKGFYEGEKNTGEIIALIHSEVSEALEADRKGKYCDLDNENWVIDGQSLRDDLSTLDDIQYKAIFEMSIKDTFEDELADSIIRILDLAAYKGIDIESHIRYKVRYNTLRPHKHGKNY